MNTVTTHSNAIFRKFGVNDRKSAVQVARDRSVMTNVAHRTAAVPPNRKGSRGDDTWMTEPISNAPIGVLPNSAV